MKHRTCARGLLIALAAAAAAAEPFAPPGQPEPVLRVETQGPRGAVTGLAFAPDGKTLYVGGYDKVVRAWTLRGGVAPGAVYRVPVGPGAEGTLNALAVSPDGRWLAAAGLGVKSEGATFRQAGRVVPRDDLTEQMLLDEGTVYVFDTMAGTFARALRGHRGVVLSLAFAPADSGGKAVLVSAARERAGDKGYAGGVRVWDAEAGTELARTLALPDPVNGSGSEPPGLAAAWRVADPAKREAPAAGLFVALAWRDGKARLWDVTRDRPAEAPEGRILNDTAAFLPDGTLWTGGLGKDGGGLQAWSVGRDGRLAPDEDRRVPLARRGAPWALAAVQSRAGAADRLAVIVRPADEDLGKTPYTLHIVSATPGAGFGKGPSVRLWPSGNPRQVVAASPDGAFLAVAGAPDSSVWVYPAARPGAEPVKLESDGEAFREVRFVRDGKARGLLLLDRAGGDGQVFDITRGRVTEAGKGWQEDAPAADGWAVEEQARGGPRFAVSRRGKPEGTVALGRKAEVTQFALLPPAGGRGAVLAVGFVERGVSYLSLFDVASGEEVRWLAGHVSPVRALAFSGDARFLVSAADDQTVCVWGLADLAETVGKRGELRGFRVRDGDGGPRVARPDPAALAPANRDALEGTGVAEGDAVEGFVAAGRLNPVRSARAFADVVWLLTPGSTATVRAGGKDVRLAVAQGIDQRVPLFSLLFTRARRAAGRQWIGWSPQGSYDTGNPARTDEYLVWHLNTNKADAPVRTATAREYRNEYFRPEILRLLLQTGRVEDALKEWRNLPLPRPDMTLHLEGPGLDPDRRDADGLLLLRSPPAGLHAAVDDLPPARIDRSWWELDGGPARPFTRRLDATRPEADLAGVRWERGVHTFRLVVRATDDARTEFGQILRVRYAPEPPAVTLKAPGEAPAVEEASFTVTGTVTAGAGAPQVKAVLRHEFTLGGKRRTEEYPVGGPRFEKKVELRGGENTLQVRAANEGAGPDSLPYESGVSEVVRVVFRPTKPVLVFDAVLAGDAATPVPADGGAVVVPTSSVRVRGRVSARDKLEEVTCDGRPLAAFRGGDPKGFSFEETLTLAGPGPQKTRFRARTAAGQEADAELALSYQPPLPGFALLRPETRVLEAGAPRRVVLEGRLDEADPRRALRVAVRLNGAEVPHTLDERRVTLTAPAELRDGVNEAEVAVSDDYGGRRAWKYTFYYPRPPAVAEVTASAAPDKPVADVRATVRTPRALGLTGARLVVVRPGGARESIDPGKDALEAGREDGGVREWVVRAAGVGLAEGTTRIEVYARNGDGESPRPGTASVTYAKPVPPPAAVEILEPAEGGTSVAVPKCVFRFRVRPAGAAAVAVLRNNNPVPAGRLQRKGVVVPGSEDFECAVADLEPRENVLEAVVTTEGGATRAVRTVTYNRPPVLIELNRLEDRGTEGWQVCPARCEQGIPYFQEAVPEGRAWLCGKVDFAEASDPGLAQPARVRAWVNGFEQFESQLDKPEGLRRTFKVAVRLNMARQNHVTVDFPDLKKEGLTPPAFTVDCRAPEADQRLHLLVLAPGVEDQEALRAAVLGAFGARKDPGGGRLRTGAFAEVVPYGLPGSFTREQVNQVLNDIRARVRRNAESDAARPRRDRRGPPNDVIIIYFRGPEVVTEKEHYLLTRESQVSGGGPGSLARTAIDCKKVRQRLAETQGAKVLLLDAVGDAAAQKPAQEFSELAPRVAVLHWLSRAAESEEARLLRALEDSLTSVQILRDVKDRVGRRARERSPRVAFDGYTSVGLDALRVGGGQGGLP